MASEFMEPLGLDAPSLASAIGACGEHVEAVVAGSAPMDAELDLRLARYFGMSEGFFLGLQNDFDLEEVRRSRGSELERIVPRAA